MSPRLRRKSNLETELLLAPVSNDSSLHVRVHRDSPFVFAPQTVIGHPLDAFGVQINWHSQWDDLDSKAAQDGTAKSRTRSEPARTTAGQSVGRAVSAWQLLRPRTKTQATVPPIES